MFYVWLAILPVVCAMFSLCVGRYYLSLEEVLRALLSPFGYSSVEQVNDIVLHIRLPRVLMALMLGAALAVAGTAFQAVFRNPLASPDTTGVSSGAAFGAALGLLLFNSVWAVQVISLMGGAIAIGFTYWLSRLKSEIHVHVILLAGVIVSSFFTALIALIKYVADPESKLPEITYWLMGSLTGSDYQDVLIGGLLILVAIFVIFLLKWRLNIMLLPDTEITALGMNAHRIRWVIIIASTILIASSVSIAGQIGWIGLVIPHMVRTIVGNDYRKIIPASISIGASYLLIVDTLCRTVTSAEIPISIVTALLGAPIFVYLFYRKREEWF
ncbi:FecCD family ABC transporter permease [Bacillus massiliigorillae]|uniref:FecCD family ABC transporter permease n=1 Tax=Bacillus massiliigorillae TaxID=1243664 RepID=UPI001E555206|nr:iron ABC transporter permease [Bacillus massiliigorillae]